MSYRQVPPIHSFMFPPYLMNLHPIWQNAISFELRQALYNHQNSSTQINIKVVLLLILPLTYTLLYVQLHHIYINFIQSINNFKNVPGHLDTLKIEEKSQADETTKNTPISQAKVILQKQTQIIPKKSLSIFNTKSIKQQIEELLEKILDHCGKDENLLSSQLQELNLSDDVMIQIQDQLVRRYTSQKKSKEEIIKFIMRKAFKFLFKTLQNSSDDNISLQKAHQVCIQHYFDNETEGDCDLNVLPFRKNSRIKTMNLTFLEKVFSSQKFVNDYGVFLSDLQSILEKDNERKFINTCENLFKIHKESKPQKIKILRRMPWTKYNIEEALKVAKQLQQTHSCLNKKIQNSNVEREPLKIIKLQ